MQVLLASMAFVGAALLAGSLVFLANALIERIWPIGKYRSAGKF